jgi:Uma2 family endonuclease
MSPVETITIPLWPCAGAYTLADLDDAPETTRVELIDGAVIVNPPARAGHQRLLFAAANWLAATLPHCEVVIETGVAFDPGTGVVPDVVVFRPGVRAADDTVWHDPATVAVVVEVESPSTRSTDRGRKADLYHAAGIDYLLVDPDERTIEARDLGPIAGGVIVVDELAAHLSGGER